MEVKIKLDHHLKAFLLGTHTSSISCVHVHMFMQSDTDQHMYTSGEMRLSYMYMQVHWNATSTLPTSSMLFLTVQWEGVVWEELTTTLELLRSTYFKVKGHCPLKSRENSVHVLLNKERYHSKRSEALYLGLIWLSCLLTLEHGFPIEPRCW